MSPAEVERYLERIRYQGSREPTLATLGTLHRAHLFSVPFENLSVRRGERIVLDESWLFEKVVTRHRGGFCYELNGLFAALLESLGFRVARLAGRVGPGSIDFDHMALRVDLDEPFLADVGFGDCFVRPLRLDDREPQDGADGKRYRLSADLEGLLLERHEGAEWKRQYAFAAKPWPLDAFEPGCRYHQTSQESHFTRNTVVSLATPNGRITLSERRLIRTDAGVRREELLAGDDEVRQILETVFEIR